MTPAADVLALVGVQEARVLEFLGGCGESGCFGPDPRDPKTPVAGKLLRLRLIRHALHPENGNDDWYWITDAGREVLLRVRAQQSPEGERS